MRRPAPAGPATAGLETPGSLRRSDSLDSLLIALSASPEVGYEAACRLAAAASGSIEGASRDWPGAANGEVRGLAQELGVAKERLARALVVAARRSSIAEATLAGARRHGVRVITRASPEYPRGLLDLELPPPALWLRGALPAAPCLSIVGPRNADRWALEIARGLAHDLAARGLVIVSGFARGVDATAHRAALEAPGGGTVAVLGCGHAIAYPQQHHELAGPISASGAVISEFPCDTPPAAWRFPVRNRIIAALGLGTLVIQASVQSGSLITARLALELGREVYAVPGRPSDRRSRGSNLLLRDGAHVALDASSILDTLPLAVLDRLDAGPEPLHCDSVPDEPTKLEAGTTVARRVLAAISEGGIEVEELSRRLELGMDVLLGVLLELELDGRVRRLSRREYAPTAGRGRPG